MQDHKQEVTRMAAVRLDGKALASELYEDMKRRVDTLKAAGVEPCLTVIRVGEDPASVIYVRNKARACEQIGMKARTLILPETISFDELADVIRENNEDPAVHGILVQLPLPAGLDSDAALKLIDPDKDVDGFHPVNSGRLFSGLPGVIACTPQGIMKLIAQTGVSLTGKEAVVVGRSNIVGKPAAMLLLRENCTVTLCHSRTADLAEHTRRADILVCAVGHAGLITADMVKPGAIVIDAGINRVDGKVVGDVCPDAADTAGWMTPVPGGVGPMTVAMLMENTLQAAERAHA